MTDTASPLGAPPQAAAPVDGSPLRPSSAWYWVAGIIAVVGIAGAITFSVTQFISAIDSVDQWPRISVPGDEQVELDEGTHTLYLEYPGANNYYTYFGAPEVEITDPDGDAVVVMTDRSSTSSYTWGNHSGVSFARFRADEDGVYDIEVRSEPEPLQEVAIGDEIDGQIVLAIFGGMGLAGLSVVAALVITIVAAVKRGKEKRRRNPPPVWRPPPPGAYGGWGPPGPGAYPPAGWGPPGSYPQPGGYPPPAPYPPAGYAPGGWGTPPPGPYASPGGWPSAGAPPPPAGAPPPAAPSPPEGARAPSAGET